MGYQLRPYAWCTSTTGCTVRTPVDFSICQRQVSVSHATTPWLVASTISNRPLPTAWAISYFSYFSPYVPAIPQQIEPLSTTSIPGINRNRSAAGMPMPWLRTWQG